MPKTERQILIPQMHSKNLKKPMSLAERLLRERFPEGPELDEAFRRLAAGEPVQYITGIAYFYDETYHVSPDCLIPRPDTERLVELAVKFVGSSKMRMLDLGTGSGCIAISTAAHCSDLAVTAVDISPGALELAEKNALHNGVADRVSFMLADMRDSGFIGSLPDGGFDIIASNPPYIATGVLPTLDRSVRLEPMLALDGGPDGLDFHRTILKDYRKKLAPGGVMLLEIGYDQSGAVHALAEEYGYICKIHRDYGGNDRVAELVLP